MQKPISHIIIIALLALLCIGASAQSYSVRVKFNTNIRAKPSLSGARLETVRAGTVLQVLDEFNKWFKVNRGGGAWMASWVAHDRVAGQPAAAADAINNCCFVDRRCQRDSQWVDGYYAFQRGECQAPASARQTEAPAPTSSSPAVNNCCFVDRQCQSDREWTDGYYAYQRGQCGAPAQSSQSGQNTGLRCQHQQELIDGFWRYRGGWCTTPADASHAHIRITELTAGFTGLVNRGFELLKRRAPEWYTFAITGLNEVREDHNHGGVYVVEAVAHYHHAPGHIRPIIPEDDITMAEFLVHEACHVHQHRQGRGGYGLVVEYECAQMQLEAAYLVGPVAHHIQSLTGFINNPHDQNRWWW